jgi:chromosome segregation ATPase
MQTQCIFLLALAFGFAAASGNVAANKISPIEKVIELIEDLLKTCKEEAKEEAKTYDEFACFCKDNTDKKSTAIKEGQTKIEEESATIGENTADLATKQTELADLIKEIDTLTTEMAEARAQRKKEAAEAAAVIADLEKACASLEGAIKALEASRPDLIQVKRTIRRSLALAEVLGISMNPKRQRAISALLQVDQPDAPEGDYEFHSEGIIDILKDLKVDFDADREEKVAEEEKAQKAHEELMAEKEEAKKTAEEAKTAAEEAIEEHKKNIAEAKEALVEAESTLKDDQLYLNDLTDRCELKAKEFDQRTVARGDEMTALSKALEIIEGASGKEAARALFIQSKDAPPASSTIGVISNHRSLDAVEDDIGDLGMAFLQESQSPRARLSSFLQTKGSEVMTLEQHKQEALSFLAAEGKRLGSTMLIATAMKLGPDPFKKVKELIQKLIERLLKEMAAEAGHKGFCDTELGKAKTSRDFEHERTQKLSAELSELEVKVEQLEEEIDTLKKELADLNDALEKATKQREEEKADNAAIVKDSSEGKAAIKDALDLLKEFYKNSAKNKVLLLELEASPIDEEGGVGAGGQAQGAYQGNQAAGGGIIAMLEVIYADFDRSVRQTTEADAEAHKAFILFDRQSKGSISTKETRQKQAEGDLKTTKMAIEDAMADLTDSQSLLDDALKAIEELKPQCIDTGMSYEERVAAREKEIEALKKALCMLDPEGVEPDC